MMAPPYIYFQDDDVTLWCGRWEGVLPKLDADSIDLTIADPPYGVKWQSQRRNTLFGPITDDDGAFDGEGMLRAVARVSRRARHVYVFGLDTFGALATEGVIGGSSELVWDKQLTGGGDLTLPWGPAHERILFGVIARAKGSEEGRLAARLRRGSVLRVPRGQGSAVTRHPTEKPVYLLRQLIESSSCLGDLVLDPCAGVGSTLVAAKLEGRRAIGVEVEEANCRIAADRLSQHALPLAG